MISPAIGRAYSGFLLSDDNQVKTAVVIGDFRLTSEEL